MRYDHIVAIAASLLFTAPANSHPPANDIRVRSQAFLDQCFKAQVCNGTYLVARNGKLLFRAAIGDSGDAARTRITLDTRFDIGSVSKQFTAVAVLHLVRRGQVALTDPVVRHLPAFPYPDVTVAQVLSHTSGIPDVLDHYSALLRSGKASEPLTGADIVAVLVARGQPARFEPGSRYEYNNSGYLVLAALVEAKTGEPFARHLDRTIFRPLRMHATLLRMPENESRIAPRALGFQPLPDGARRPFDQLPGFFVQGAGGIYSTVDDLHTWHKALSGGRILTRAEWRQATTATTLPDGSRTPYGLGIALRTGPSGLAKIGHNGHYRGFKAEIAHFPDSDITVIQLTNNAQERRLETVADALRDIALGKAPSPVLPSIASELHRRLLSADGEDVHRWFTAQRAASPATFEIREGELNALGYRNLQSGAKDRAVLVFELAAEAFPGSANAHDSLSEALEASGNRSAALAEAQAALAIEPGSPALQQRVQELSTRTN